MRIKMSVFALTISAIFTAFAVPATFAATLVDPDQVQENYWVVDATVETEGKRIRFNDCSFPVWRHHRAEPSKQIELAGHCDVRQGQYYRIILGDKISLHDRPRFNRERYQSNLAQSIEPLSFWVYSKSGAGKFTLTFQDAVDNIREYNCVFNQREPINFSRAARLYTQVPTLHEKFNGKISVKASCTPKNAMVNADEQLAFEFTPKHVITRN